MDGITVEFEKIEAMLVAVALREYLQIVERGARGTLDDDPLAAHPTTRSILEKAIEKIDPNNTGNRG